MANTGKKWSLLLLASAAAALLIVSAVIAIIDPFFHYHAPLPFLQYPLDKERYQNDGIVKHFSYDAMITGTSMTENFKTSECDALFGVNTVKTCFNGSSLREASENLSRAVSANPNIRLVIRGYDGWNLLDPPGKLREEDKIPFYLYDNNPFNDVSYLLNKTVLIEDTVEVLRYTLHETENMSFDEYANWNQYAQFGAESVLANYTRPSKAASKEVWTEVSQAMLAESLQDNAIRIALENPQIQFYYFFTPYSIITMDEQNQYGILEKQFDAFRQATEAMVAVENIHLFSFFDDYEIITNLNNYYDPAHYHEDINSIILQRMAEGENKLTSQNWESYWDEVEVYYLNYDYDRLFS